MSNPKFAYNSGKLKSTCVTSNLKLSGRYRKLLLKSVLPCLIILAICMPIGVNPNGKGVETNDILRQTSPNQYGLAQGDESYSSSGSAQQFALQGVVTNETQGLVLLNPSSSTSVPINAPAGWTGDALSGTIESISTRISQIRNGRLDAYHGEHFIVPGSTQSATTVYVPDDWSLIEKGESVIHPRYGRLYFLNYTSGHTGRNGTMGWEFVADFGTSNPISPSMELYLSQPIQMPWREVYSAEITFSHFVRVESTMNNRFFLFVRLGDYENKIPVFQSGYTTEKWIDYTVAVPAAAFASVSIPGSLDLEIGIGTDYSGNPPATVLNRVLVDAVNIVFEARPFPEQIGLSANQTVITGYTPADVSPYVPDGAYRDCYDIPTTGIASSPLDVGVKGTSSDWSDANKYQIGFQFPLNIPRGAVVTSARLEVEAQSAVGGGNNGLRIYVAQQDTMAAFSTGLPHLESRYSWSETSIDWMLNQWVASSRYQSPDISSLIQRVIARPDWSSGNYVGLMLDYMFSDSYNDYNRIKGTVSYNDVDLARLFVEYSIPKPDDSISVFAYKKSLTIDHTKVGANLQDFPILVDIFDSDLKTKAQPDGDDIRFMLGLDLLDHQIELYDPNYNLTHAHLIAWVRIPYLSSLSDTVVTMIYGAPDANNAENPTGVWMDRYESIWHMSEPSGTGAYVLDSSSNHHDATPTGTLFMDNGMIDGARYIQNSGTSYVAFDNAQDILNGWYNWQFSLWMYPDFDSLSEWQGGSSEPDVFYKSTSMTLARVYSYDGITGTFQIDTHFVGHGTSYFTVSIRNKAWNYITMKYESSGDGRLRAYNYVDGALFDSYNELIGTGDRLLSDSSSFYLGSQNPGNSFRGGMDEYRTIKNGYTSPAWIQTEYANQYSPSSFYSVNDEQALQFGSTAELQFASTATSIVKILPRLMLNATYHGSTFDEEFQPGTSFSVSNGTYATWIANVLVSPPSCVSQISLTLDNPSTWTLMNVADPIGNNRLLEVSTTDTQISVPSSVLDVYGVWTFGFWSANEASALECGVNTGAYYVTASFQVGDAAKFRGMATLISESAMRLHLVDPSGQLFYSEDDLSQDGSGQFEWTDINVDTTWPSGLWEAQIDFNETADSTPTRVGRYSRFFTVIHASSLQLVSPSDVVGDSVSVRTAGDLLTVEVQLTDTVTAKNVTGSTILMNWTVSGMETNVQLKDYGTGIYGKTLNTSDLGQPGNWRINIQSSHPYLVNSNTYFDLELSDPTVLTYMTPAATPYGDDFSVLVTLKDAITGARYSGASFSSNGSIIGTTDYNNGTYLIRIDSIGLSAGVYAFQLQATPTQSFVVGSSIQIVFRYREIVTDLVQGGVSPVVVPWGQDTNVTLEWQDTDHGDAGISGGLLTGDGSFLYSDNLDGTYSVEIDVDSLTVGTYIFNFTMVRANYQVGQITVTVSVISHKTLTTATSPSSVPLGANTSVTLSFVDSDLGNTAIGGNVSSVLVVWSGGSSVHGSLQFTIETQNWAVGTYTIHITIRTATPRYYQYAETIIVLDIRKMTTSIIWDDIGVIPIGDDFEITTHIIVNDSASIHHGMPVDGLIQNQFTIKAQNGTIYSIKSFIYLGSGAYSLTLDFSLFANGTYGIRVYLTFGVAENYSSTQTPLIVFEYAAARSDMSSPDFPHVSVSFSTDAIITLEFVDIDRGQGINTATIYVNGAEKLDQQLISSGRYRVTLSTSTWSIGTYSVTFTASALNYENQTISIQVEIRQIRTYATATAGILDIPVGDSKSFFVDYRDMDHNLPVFTLTHECNWSSIHYDIVWTGTRYQVTIHTFDSDTLGSYVLVFEFSSSAEYENASFIVSIVVRTISTEMRLLAPVQDATSSSNVSISIYYGDRDHSIGIVSAFVECAVWNSTDPLLFLWFNGTSAGTYRIRLDASQFGSLGIQHLTIYFTWTGSVQKYQNKALSVDLEILGEGTELTLIESALPSPCLEYMVYTFLYSQASTGMGITNDTGNVFINIDFEGLSIDLSQVDIWEIDSLGRPGEYSIGFNNSILGRTGTFVLQVFINWSEGVSPYYTNRIDLISVRVLSRSALLTVIPPTSVSYGENATFSFTYDDTTGGLSSPIAYNPLTMMISLNVSDYTFSYNAVDRLYTLSFNTSQLGALGQRAFTLDVIWIGLPFYTNATGRVITVTLAERQTSLTYPTPPSTPYGDWAAFTIVFLDIAGATPREVQGTVIEVYNGPTQVPVSFLNIVNQGAGSYRIQVNTSYFTQPGQYSLVICASSSQFYYQSRQSTRTFIIHSRETLLTVEPPRDTPYGTSLILVLHYQDLDTLESIGNGTELTTMLAILNGSSWIFTCVWRPSFADYLVTVETYNQPLAIGTSYHLWLNFSTENKAPFYNWQDILVSFRLRERDTSINLVSAPVQTRYQDYANFTILYRDIASSTGITGGTISVYFGGTPLQPSVDYLIFSTDPGTYRLCINTASLGIPGIKTIIVKANWTGGSPYYDSCQRSVNIQVVWRPSSVEVTAPPQDTWYLENVTFDFAFTDIATGKRVPITTSAVDVYNNGVLLAGGQYTITPIGLSYRISINSSIISSNLVNMWNITVHVTWPGGAPYYLSDSTTVKVTTIGRAGNVDQQQIEDTPFGDIMNITLLYTDQKLGTAIEGAIIALDCVEYPGLIQGSDYWVIPGTGAEAGKYRILMNTSSLGSFGRFTFRIDITWNQSQAPYYRNIMALEMEGVVRAVQTSLSSDIPTPSVVPFYGTISFIVEFSDEDHGTAISGAEAFIALRYQSTGLEPSSWSVTAITAGQYNITLNMVDSLTKGLQTLIISIDMFPYLDTETQAVFGLRDRIAGLSADVAPTNYAGYSAYVTIYLADYDAEDAPLVGATLILTWADLNSYVDLVDGRYNVTLRTANLNSGSHFLAVQASLAHYSISPLNIKINLLAVPSELIVTWSGPTGSRDIFWGESLSIYAALNDTLRNHIVSSALITFDWEAGTGSFSPTGMIGNYSAVLDTSLVSVANTIVVTITGTSPNYISASYLVVFRLLPRPMEVIPQDSQYVFSIPWGGTADIVVYLEDSLDGFRINEANLTAGWEYAGGLNFIEMEGGFYRLVLSAGPAGFGSYEIQIDASKENYGNSSALIILSVSEIQMVMWLDNNTATYEYTPVYWSEIVRIGVYVLAPTLNPSDPFSTGLDNLIVTWYSPELGRNGTLLNGTLIGGRGYYYYDFDTSIAIAAVHTFRIRALPPSSDYTDAENSTAILVQNLVATILFPGSQEFSWGWTGLINFTYYDSFHGLGVQAGYASCSWAGGNGLASYLGAGQYGIPIDTSILRPGTYTMTITCQKPNYNDVQIVLRIHIEPVPTEVILDISDIYQIAGNPTNLRIPYGDVLNISLVYNNTVSGVAIPYANFSGTYYSGPGFFEEQLTLIDMGDGTYSFLFATIPWDINSRFSFHVQFMLDNYTSGILAFDILVIEIPTTAVLEGPATISLNWGMNTTFWISYSDIWPGHDAQGIDGAVITINVDSPQFATVEYIGPDQERPGWYQFRIIASRNSGVAGVTISLNRTYYAYQTVTLSVSTSPSAEDIALQNTITYGSAFIIFIILGAIVWVRILRVPKIVRIISGQIRTIRKGKIPKPAKGVQSRRALVADIFNDLYGPTGIKRKVADIPLESITVEVPEIEELIIDLSILTGMTQEELDDFKFEISKMKMSQQTNFVREVIAQELTRVATLHGKSVEQVLQEVVLERKKRIGGEATPTKIEDYAVPKEQAATAEPQKEGIVYEDRLRESELGEMAVELQKRGIPKHEIESFIAQSRDLPKDVVQMLLQSFQPRMKSETSEKEIEHLTDEEIEDLRTELIKRKASKREIDSILEQARRLPKELALELFKEEEPTSRKRKEKVETLSGAEFYALRDELEKRRVPDQEIDAIMNTAKTAPKKVVREYIESIDTVLPPEGEIEFEDTLGEMEIAELRIQLEERNLPSEEVEAILKQAIGLPRTLIHDLLRSIDADRDSDKK
jgi:hypothetical protein